jgi:serine/threonine protein kinase
MTKNLHPGDTVNGYTIVRHLNTGAFALAYEAKDASGDRVFFKQYKSPSVAIDWFRGYVAYQQELKHRVETSRVKNFTYSFKEFFTAKAGPETFFQVFEFVASGDDLEATLKAAERHPATLAWEQRVTLAKVLMTGIQALHEAKIIHTDLKPANIFLFKDTGVAAGYRLKVIDMDFAILADLKAPWHGIEGYVGSPGYMSPEHLQGKVPVSASDVYTCGLMLYELLAQGHPYRLDDDEAYQAAALNHSAARPKLQAPLPRSKGVPDNAQVEELLFRCLSPVAAERPTAGDVVAALNGIQDGAITLIAESGAALHANLDLSVGRDACRVLSPDYTCLADLQFKLVRVAGMGWFADPNPQAPNETLLNLKAITTRTALKTGDVLGVGRAATGVQRLPLTVTIGAR